MTTPLCLGIVRRMCFLALIAGALGRSGVASTPPSYFIQSWQTEHGLPQNSVTAIVQHPDGYLWLGTYNGLVRFDGVRFAVFNNSNTPELQSNRVTSLFVDATGRLWIGHETGHVTRLAAGRFEAVDIRAHWSHGRILGIGADADGSVWLMTDDGLLVRVDDGSVVAPPVGNAVGVIGLAQDRRGLLITRHGRVSLLDHGRLATARFDLGFSNDFVQGVGPSREGGLWIASDGELRQWSGNTSIENLGAAPWGVSQVTSLIEMQDGTLAAGTSDQGLFLRLSDGTVMRFDRTNGLPQDWIRCMYEDREGNLWLAAGSSGLVALRTGKVATISPPDQWQQRAVLSVSAGRDGALWVSTEGAGLYRLQEGEWTHFGEGAGLANPFVWSVCEDALGRLWAGTWGGGLFVLRGDVFERAPGLEEVLTPMPALHPARDGGLWVGTGAGLLHYLDGAATWYGRNGELNLPDVRAVLETGDGTVWFGMSGGGLGRLQDGALRQFRRSDGLSSDFVQCLRMDEDGALWIGTFGGGLNRFKDGRFAVIDASRGLPNDVICHIEDDGHGYFWLSSFGGILRVRREHLNQCADGRLAAVECLTYGTSDGLPTLECSGGLQPAGLRTADGRLWFPTTKGLVNVDPRLVKSNQLPPPVVIESLWLDGHSLNLRSPAQNETPATRSPAPIVDPHSGAIVVPPGRHRLQFGYTGLSFVAPEKVRFKYRLDGLETEWLDAGAQRAANYSYVPPGHYTFRVLACNNDGIWNETGASLDFTVLPYFWQTLWFRVLAGLGMLSVVGSGVWFDTRRRMRRKLEGIERQRAVERERTRIAKDIHDDLGASLTRITMLSQTARGELDNPAQAAVDLDRIYSTARELTRAMDEIVWAVNPQHDTLDSLASYLGRLAQDFLSAAGVRCRLDLPVHLPSWPVTAEVRHNLFLAFKEALHNAIMHAGAGEVRVSLALCQSGFILELADDGCGFAPGATHGLRSPDRIASGNGLTNMHRRLAEIGGCCEVRSAPGEGATIRFVVNVKAR